MKTMKTLITLLILTAFTLPAMAEDDAQSCPSWLQHSMTKLHSDKKLDLCALTQGKVALIVNTASSCGFTPQFKGLEALYEKYQDQGLVIIGFPSDSFFQEHDNAEKTAEVCYINYGVTFPMVASSSVRGSKANPVFQHLNETLGSPKWNFYKYLVDREGKAVKRFGSMTKPDDADLITEIEKLLK